MCGPLLSWIEWPSGENTKTRKRGRERTLTATHAGWRGRGGAGKGRVDQARCPLGIPGRAKGSGEERGWAWREGPEVHSLSAMQMPCK